MPTDVVEHYVFVDLENVPEVDLSPLVVAAAQVTLLIGNNQKKLNLGLVKDIHRLANRATLVEVGASGRNALDLTLAYYLGQAVVRAPSAGFYIISRDEDYDPMIAHLKTATVKVARLENTVALPFVPKAKKTPPAKKPAAAKQMAVPVAHAVVPANDAEKRLEALITNLRANPKARPKNRTKLLAHLNAHFGGKLSEAEQKKRLADLVQRGMLSFDGAEKVIYQFVE